MLLKKLGKKSSALKSLVYIMSALVIGFILNISIRQNDLNNNSWQNKLTQNVETSFDEESVLPFYIDRYET